MQSITEANLETLFGLDFVSTEFERDGLRIDTLAFDHDANAFVIIEYKRDQTFSVVDQGFAYLSLMLNNKEVFLVEYNEKKNGNLKRDEIDWSQSKIVFVAKGFTNYQQAASGFKDLPIELWQVTRYDGGLILYNRIETKKSLATISALRPGNVTEEVVKQVTTYPESDLIPKEGVTKALYEELRDRLLKLDDELRTHPTKTYISFRRGENWRNIFSIQFRIQKLRIELFRTKPSDLEDPENKIVYIKESMQYWNQHVSYLEVINEKGVEYAIYILQQALERFRASQEK